MALPAVIASQIVALHAASAEAAARGRQLAQYGLADEAKAAWAQSLDLDDRAAVLSADLDRAIRRRAR